ncbi:MAG: serine hydrolase [Bacteroidia bacterium]|nr:serine hydrolase [Bacteroidia bacterium]NNL79434.1 serine hydrolase [Flavobacteriaceae bacterium]
MRTFFSIIAIAFFSILNLNAQAFDKQLKLLDDFIVEGIEKWKPPGLAVTVVKDDNIIFTKTYGKRTVGTDKKVDENTLFGCMSTTKAFVSAGLAMLVDEGKIQWDDKVIDHLPDFRLKDAYITRELTIRDLLTHRSGLGNSDYLWSMMSISGDSAYHKLKEIDKSYSLRSSFIYQNLMYHTAGKVIEAKSGKSWGQFLDERIFKPLQMNRTYPLLSSIETFENKADAHYDFDGKITKVPQMSVDKVGAAGSMWSTISDIGQWIKFLLNEGRVENDTLIQPATFKELYKPQQLIPSSQFYPTQQVTKPNWMTYGLGWFQHDYKDKMVQFHTGSLPGMVAIAGMIPEDNVGVYVMGNLDHVELRHAIMYAAFDLFTEGKLSRNWSEELYPIYHPEEAEKEEPQRTAGTKPSFLENDLLGKYHHDRFGWVELSKKGNQLEFNMNNTIYGTLSHWHYDTYKAVFRRQYMGEGMINFRLGSNGKLSHAELFGEDFIKL